METLETLGDRIKRAREAAGFTQIQLAQILGTQWQQVSRWERNVSEPRKKTRKLLAEALRISEENLLTVSVPVSNAVENATFNMIEELSEGANVLIIGQALQAMLKALPPRGISLEDPRLGQLFQAIVRRSVQTGIPPDEKMVLEELLKPIS